MSLAWALTAEQAGCLVALTGGVFASGGPQASLPLTLSCYNTLLVAV